MTATFTNIADLITESFCTLGCGGDVGLLFVGIAGLIIFMLAMYKMNLGLDGIVVGGGFFVIILSAAGYLPAWMEALPWIVAGFLWVSALWIWARR